MANLKSLLLTAFLLKFAAATHSIKVTMRDGLKKCVTMRELQQDGKTSITCDVDKTHFNCQMPESKREKKINRNRRVKILINKQKWVCSLSDMCEAMNSNLGMTPYPYDASWMCELFTKDLKLRHSLEDCLWSKTDLKKVMCPVNQTPSDCSAINLSYVNETFWSCSPLVCGNGPKAKIRPGYDCIAQEPEY
jgi:hypothetical protein